MVKEITPRLLLTTFGPQTVSFSPELNGGFTTAWNSDFAEASLTLTDWEHDLGYSTKYTVTLSDEIKDTTGAKLDGDA